MSTETGTITISVNGEPVQVRSACLLADVVPHVTTSRGIAAALNGTVVARSAWPVTRVAAGDAVEVVTAVQGG